MKRDNDALTREDLADIRAAVAKMAEPDELGRADGRWDAILNKLGGPDGSPRRTLALLTDEMVGIVADVEREESRVVDAIDRLTSTVALTALLQQYPGHKGQALRSLEIAAGLKRPRPPKGRPAVVLDNDETAGLLEAVASMRGTGDDAVADRFGRLLKKLSAAFEKEAE
jgi:N-acyl-D-aspartate/D-glutamate deacylase